MTKKIAGFTLIELLVSITIGAIVLTSAFGIYAQFIQTKIQIDISRQMQKEINFALARITDRVRNCKIKNESDENNLKLDCDTIFSIDEESIYMNENLLTSNKFLIKNDSKFVITNNEDSQPKVQIHLNVESKQDTRVSQAIRTTISSRLYE